MKETLVFIELESYTISRYSYKLNVSVSNENNIRIHSRCYTDIFRVQVWLILFNKSIIILYSYFNFLISQYKRKLEHDVNNTISLIQRLYKKNMTIIFVFVSYIFKIVVSYPGSHIYVYTCVHIWAS